MDSSSSSLIQDLPDELSPSSGRTPTLFDPPTEALAIKAVEGVFVSLMLIAVAIRLYVRAAITKQWRGDDFICILAACGSIVHMILTIQLVEMDARRQWHDNPAAISFRIWFANSQLYPWTTAFARISIMLLCLRTFGADRRVRQIIWFAFTFQLLYATGVQFVGVARDIECDEDDFAHDTSSFCRHVARALDSIINTFNTMCDVFVVIMPAYLYLWTTKPSFWQKVGAVVLYCCGILFIGFNCLRQSGVQINEDGGPDFIWIATIIQITTIIIFACVPTFPAFHNHLLFSQFRFPFSSKELTMMIPQPQPPSQSRNTSHHHDSPSPSSSINSRNDFQTPPLHDNFVHQISDDDAEGMDDENERDGNKKNEDRDSKEREKRMMSDYSTFVASIPVSNTEEMKQKQGYKKEKEKEKKREEEGRSLTEI